ncbi:hypothetical protein [Brevibacillus ruminantium]|nr:hypothetical protein [Brevibacillus ruminantium]
MQCNSIGLSNWRRRVAKWRMALVNMYVISDKEPLETEQFPRFF